ncbi:hypothetical protein SAMD00019534_022270 [Acytostelium subglobosum LB1]|uniref:hypothetical protein n=1 Tax=Acytostelium subglobosum LB1 TaxID=1410327 RepID=UPI0006447FC8|nr:hypothetical protein SAMD00019534_022270 [Acytostelium subglobosum LB1]GAM19052.1 hypothetical protein SAMD00019534_022270 [Acytostelium subglobosum LB1]|eukprot:XP_012756979.1 hypothetical protein SAMD00019534_022270 [Acytostelium subglobosum LB1]
MSAGGALENYYVALTKAVSDTKSNNQLLKFDILCSVDALLERMNKMEADTIAGKWISILCNCLLQTTGSSLAVIIGGALSRLFDLPSGSKTSVTNVKSILTAVTAKQTSLQIKSSLIEALGIIYKSSRTLALVYLAESFQLISRMVKAGECRAQAIRAMGMMIESIGTAGTHIHQEAFRLIKGNYNTTSITGYTEFKLECLAACLPIIRYYNNSDVKLQGYDQKMLLFTTKALDDENINVNKKAAEMLGKLLAALFYKESVVPNIMPGAKPPVAVAATLLASKWMLETCQNYLGNQFISATKKDLKINVSLAYTTFFQNIKIANIEKEIDATLSHLLKLLGAANRNLSQSADQTQARACISYILRNGLGQRLSESGQQSMVRFFANILSQPDTFNELTMVVCLQELCQLINELGEGGITQPDDLSTYLFTLLNDRNQSIRQCAAVCLRALASNIPKYTSKYLSQCLLNLTSILEEFDRPNIQPEPLKKIMNSVKGNALGITSLIATLRQSDLGVPTALLQQIARTAQSLLANPDLLNPAITLTRLEAGWLIMNSLIRYMGESFVEPLLPSLFASWKTCFSITTVHPTLERDIVIFSKTRADALLPLHSLVAYNAKLINSKVVNSIVTFLGNTLKTVSELPASSFQASTNEIMKLLELNLIRTFQAIPAAAYAQHHTTLMTVVATLILDGSHNTLLPSLLSKDDQDILAPDFTSTQYQFDSAFLMPLSTQDNSFIAYSNIQDCFSPYKTQNLEIRVVNASIELFSTLFISQPDRHRTQLLDHLANCVRESSNPVQKSIMTVNAMTALLYILRTMSTSNLTFGKSEVAGNIQRFVQKYFGDTNPLLRRASAESLGILCRLEGDGVTNAIINSLTEIIRKLPKEVPSTVRAGSAFVLGCIQRSVGGMMSQKYLPSTIANLHRLAQDSLSSEVSMHALHALYITIQTSGTSFTPYASPTLMLLQTLLLNESPPYQLLGRVVNSIVIALGPELGLENNKDVLQKCTSTCSIIQNNENMSIRVESIYYQQKLIMFAPATVNESIIPFIISQFKSPYLMLRISSVTCLRQLLNRKSNVDIGMNIVEDLFMMIDTECDNDLQKEIKLLINTIIDTIAAANPSTWLYLCMNIILSSKQMTKDSIQLESPSPTTARQQAQAASPTSGSNDFDEEKDDDEDVKVVVKDLETKVDYVYRWFTKVFAIECVRRVISVVRNKPEHFNMLLAQASQNSSRNDHLILHLHELVGIAFKAATSQIDSMRPVGVLLLKDIIEGFSSSIDPDYEGHLLLELYQAQIMSALRPAFSPDAAPDLLSVGCAVFVNFIEGSLHYDSAALKKTTAQLSASVKDLRNLNFPIYNEKATTLVQLSILKTFAQLYLLCRKKESLNTILSTVITPILPYLRVHWVVFLREYALLVSQPPAIYPLCKPMFFSPLTYTESIDYFKEAYPFVLRALASLIGTPHWLEGRDGDDAILSETQSIADLNIILGLSLLPQDKFLSEPTDKNLNPGQMALTLETIALVFQPSSITVDEFPLERVKELSQVLARVSAYGSNKHQLLVVDIVNNLFVCFGDSITMEDELFTLLLKVLFEPLKLENEEYYVRFYQCCTFIIKTMSAEQCVRYAPLFIWAAIQGLSTTQSSNTTLMSSAIQLVATILKNKLPTIDGGVSPPATTATANHSDLLNASIITTIESMNKQEQTNKQGLLLMLSTLIVNHHEIGDGVAHVIVEFFKTTIQNKTNNNKDRLCTLQVLRNILHSGAGQAIDSPMHSFASKLVGELFVDLHSCLPAPSPVALKSEDMDIVNELFKLFTLSLSLTIDNDAKSKVLLLVVQTMILYLNPNNTSLATHASALQSLLSFASTQPQFKEVVAVLPVDQKQALEQSIRKSVEQPAAMSIKLPQKPQIQLTFDFSKVANKE